MVQQHCVRPGNNKTLRDNDGRHESSLRITPSTSYQIIYPTNKFLLLWEGNVGTSSCKLVHFH